MSITYETPTSTGHTPRHTANPMVFQRMAMKTIVKDKNRHRKELPLPPSHLWKLKNTSANNSLLLFLSFFFKIDSSYVAQAGPKLLVHVLPHAVITRCTMRTIKTRNK